MIPNENCYADLDPSVKDKWGIPVLRFHWKWSEHEINQADSRGEDVRRTDRGDGRHASDGPQGQARAIALEQPG